MSSDPKDRLTAEEEAIWRAAYGAAMAIQYIPAEARRSWTKAE